MRSPITRAAFLLVSSLTFAAPVAAADVLTRLDPIAARVFSRTMSATPDAAGLLEAAEPAGTLMSVDADAMAAFRAAGGGRLAIPAEGGTTVELELEPFDVMAEGASVSYTDDFGRHEYRPDLTLYRGHVAGDEKSWAVVSMGEAGLFGAVEQGRHRWTLSPAQAGTAGASGNGVHAFTPEGSLASAARRFMCGVTDENAAELGLRTLPATPDGGRMATPNSTQLNGVRFVLQLAVDCDYEIYGVKFGSNLPAATAYIQTVLGTVNLIYERDLEVTMPIVYLNLWTTTSDPYTAANTSAQLTEFRAYWLANNGGISSHLKHLISGRGLGGGIAFLDAVCSGNAYGVSAIDAVYSYPTFTTTWDVNVIAHELGHNFGSPHTHSCTWAAEGRVPSGTLDSCETAEGGCASYSLHLPPDKGTIMSYCHLISGVANGIRLEFHTVCVSRMRGILSSCGLFPTPAPPRNPIASTISSGVRLTWTNSPSSGVLRYSVYRSRLPLDLGSGYLGFSLTSPYDSPGLGTYYYRIRSIRTSDSSATSGEVKATACAFVNAPNVAVGSQPTAARSADLNEDGIQDVVLVTTGGGNLVTLIGQGAGGVGNGTFAAPANVTTGVMPACLALLDANGDGILDAVVGGQDANSLYLHLGQGAGGVGDGTFGAVSTIAAVGFAPTGLIVADVNEDGLDDLVAAGGASSVALLLGQGTAGVPNGTFATPVSVATGGLTRGLIAGDWNGDGITDLAVSGIGVRLMYGNGTGGRGDGTFTQGPNVATGSVPNHLATGDFDMDGVTDLVVCNTSTNSLSVLLGNGTAGAPDGTFAAALSVTTGSGPNAVAVADYDHDGLPDLVVATNSNPAGTSVMLGRGDGTFDTSQLFSTGGNGTSSIAVQDYNEDGTPDLLACNRTSLNVTRQLAGCAGSLSSAITVVAPNGGESWIGSTEHTITWTKGPGVFKVDVQLSTDGGTNWRTLAAGLTGTSFAWTATGPYGTQARIRVVDSHAEQFADASDANFELVDESTLAVGDGTPRFALLGAWPNPARQDLTVSFALPSGEASGTLDLIDLAGRRVASRDLAGFSAGRHQVTLLDRRALTPGVYMLRLTRGGEVRSMKVAVVR